MTDYSHRSDKHVLYNTPLHDLEEVKSSLGRLSVPPPDRVGVLQLTGLRLMKPSGNIHLSSFTWRKASFCS